MEKFRKDRFEDNDSESEEVFSPRSKTTMMPESDSYNEGTKSSSARKKKRMTRRHRTTAMEIDPQTSTKKEKKMELDEGEESHISSSDAEEEFGGVDADDEQSDWVGYSGEGDFFDTPDRKHRRTNSKSQMSQLQKRLEKFALEGGKGEMGLEFKMRDRPNSAHFNRMLLQYRLEVVKRQRGNVVLRRKLNSCSAVKE
ncbi:unnamed protein product [Auanema sp. JU1783]|nr:unnamed protein product [Auanema sp. JU1783]